MKTNLVLQDDDLIVHRQNNVEPTLDRVRAKREAEAWDNSDGSMRHVGTVDKVLFNQMLNDAGVTWAQFMRDDDLQERMLVRYFAEHPAFKIAPGRNL